MKQQFNIKNTIQAKKSLGQNFIHDDIFLQKLSSLIKTDTEIEIIEIGPGTGSLTDKIVKRKFRYLHLIEKDKNLCDLLLKKYKKYKNIFVYNQDALEIDYFKIIKSKKVIIIGNLPFNISSQLLIRWLSYSNWPPFYYKMYLMFQNELGKRIMAKKNNKAYGKISVLAQSRFLIKQKIIAPANVFHPKPKVDGIVLEFTPIDNFKDVNISKLKEIVDCAFQKRRKKISNSLIEYKSYFRDWESVKDLRAENLGVSEYCYLSNQLNKP